MNKIVIFWFIVLYSQIIFGQQEKLETVLGFLHSVDVEAVENEMKSFESDSITYYYLQWELIFLKEGKNDLTLHERITQLEPQANHQRVLKQIHLGNHYLTLNIQQEAYENYSKALEYAKKGTDSVLTCIALEKLIKLTQKNLLLKAYSRQYITEYKQYSVNYPIGKFFAHLIDEEIKIAEEISDSITGLKDVVNYLDTSSSDYCYLKYYLSLGLAFDYDFNQKDSALWYYTKAEHIIGKYKTNYTFSQSRKSLKNNLGCIYYDIEKFPQALRSFQMAYKLESTKRRMVDDSIIVDWIARTHIKLNNQDSALYYYQKKDTISRQLGQAAYAGKIEELKRKYDIDEANQKNMTLLIILIGFVIISLLVFINLKRKQLLAKREKQLEAEKLEKLLNEQELIGINAMVEGQEKERKRIANELHDDLGSSMATLRLYAENARNKNEQIVETHDKMLHIIDDVYQRVRGMAHTRNSGVKGSKGLLPAIERFANKISDSDQLQVEVMAFNMNKHYESELELEIFRIIKELITNVIKHAAAAEILIQLTQYEDYLNIIVQDDGKGFNPKEIHQKDGMGLHSIEKRIESKNGTMQIDSSFISGTTITLNMPTNS